MSFIRDYMSSDKYNVFNQRNSQRVSNQYIAQVSAPMFQNFDKYKNPDLNKKKQPNFLILGIGFLFLTMLMNKK